MPQFNGHRSWNSWNVSLWIFNDEGIYRFAVECRQKRRSLTMAVSDFMQVYGGTKTPDGAVYNSTCVREALADIDRN